MFKTIKELRSKMGDIPREQIFGSRGKWFVGEWFADEFVEQEKGV